MNNATQRRLDYLAKIAPLKLAYAQTIKTSYKDGKAIPKIAEVKQEKTLEEQAQDKTLQNNLFLENMKTIMQAGEAQTLINQLDSDAKLFVNRNFIDIKKELAGRTVGATFFIPFLRRYIDRFTSTGNTGIITPLTPETLEAQLDTVRDRIGLLGRRVDASRIAVIRETVNRIEPILLRLSATYGDTAKTIVDNLTTAIEQNDVRTAQRILEIIQQMESTGDFRQEQLVRYLQEIQDLSEKIERRVYDRAELQPTISVLDLKAGGFDAITALDLRIQTSTTLKNIIEVLQIPNKSKYRKRTEMIPVIEQTIASLQAKGEDPVAQPQQPTLTGRFPNLEIPRDAEVIHPNVYAVFFYTSINDLQNFVDGYQPVKDYLEAVYDRNKDAWRGATKSDLAYSIYKYFEFEYSEDDPYVLDFDELTRFLKSKGFPVEQFEQMRSTFEGSFPTAQRPPGGGPSPGSSQGSNFGNLFGEEAGYGFKAYTRGYGIDDEPEIRMKQVGSSNVARRVNQVIEEMRRQRNMGATQFQSLFRRYKARSQFQVLREQERQRKEELERQRQEAINRKTDESQAKNIQRVFRDFRARRAIDPRIRNMIDQVEQEFALRAGATARGNPDLEALFEAYLVAVDRVPPTQDLETPDEAQRRRQREQEAGQAKLAFIERRAQMNHGPAYNQARLDLERVEETVRDITNRGRIATEALDLFRANNRLNALAKVQEINPRATMADITRRNLMALRREADRDLAVATQQRDDAERQFRLMRGTGVNYYHPRKQGKGSRVVYGRGIAYDDDVNYNEFGKYILHRPSLKYNIINIKYPSMSPVRNIAKKTVSDDFVKIMKDLVDLGELNENKLNKLSKIEREYFYDICKKARVDDLIGLDVPEDENDDWQRFQIVKGQVIAGNNDPELIRELRGFLIKYSNDKRIPRNEALELLQLLNVLV